MASFTEKFKSAGEKVSGASSAFAEKVVEKTKDVEAPGFYKGYDIRWLRSVKDEHADGYLVDEYDKEQSSKKEVSNG